LTTWRTWLPSALVCLALGSSVGAGEIESPPVRVVNRLHEALLGVLRQAEVLGYKGRLDRLAPALDDAFDMDFMAEKSLGREWTVLSEEQKKRWCATFKELTRANYAARFNRYSGQTFEMLAEEPAARETVLVRTKVVDPADENVSINYRLHETEAGWEIIDVYLKGTVSELALRRSEYTSVLKRDGFEALISAVDRKIADLAAGRVEE
jgi:phospholipid transport system substrate-binding protein